VTILHGLLQHWLSVWIFQCPALCVVKMSSQHESVSMALTRVLCHCVVGLSSFVPVWSWLVQFCVSVKLAFPVLCQCGVGLSSIVLVWSWLVQFCVSVKSACPVLCQCEVGLSSFVSVWSWLVQFCVSVKLACYVFFAAVPFRSESRSGLRARSRVYKQTSIFLSDLGVHCGLQNCRMLRFLSSFWPAALHS